ncbi:MAG TPA: hypothetical protein VK783_12750 [Bacteroidia bacterium]|nr:hypothetical protein [Bacteroidia bacterium]
MKTPLVIGNNNSILNNIAKDLEMAGYQVLIAREKIVPVKKRVNKIDAETLIKKSKLKIL